jgi:flagellar biosynthetic protein FlhB
MSEQSDQERTEQATGKRRDEFRKKGQVAQSKEVHTAALLTASLLLWMFYGPVFWRRLSALVADLWRRSATTDLSGVDLPALMGGLLGKMLLLLAPLLLLTLVVGFFSSFLQIGWLVSSKPLQPDLAKFNPVSGVMQLVSRRSAVELVKSLTKILLIAVVAYKAVASEFDGALLLADMPVIDTVRYLGRVAAKVLTRTCGVLVLLALADFLYVRWDLEQKMKMTKQEQKEEFKETEGNPQLKSRIRSLQHQMARKRMMAEVPKADVVITNPTHYAVALRYERGGMAAPQVIAKGADHVALHIRELARKHRVPVVENKPVARALYRVELGQPVPEEMFKAVAEILAYVYSLKRK